MEEMPPAPFGDLLRRHRLAAGLTQEALAERAGLSVRAITDLERGVRRAPYRDTVRMLADALALDETGRTGLELAARRPRAGRAGPDQEGRRTANLPVPLTPLLGREREVTGALRLLRRSEIRLVTITGAGGIGKTRVGLAVAAEARDDFVDGVAFVPLAPVADPDLVVSAIIRALDLVEPAGQTPAAFLAAYLQEKHLLLVLDNFEHVLPAAPVVADLLQRCPRLVVLATSRAPLRLAGEHDLLLPPLALPEHDPPSLGEHLREYAAVELFCQRSAAVNHAFALTSGNAASVAAIVRCLDGLPLAIELAAARGRTLTPEALLARLERRLPLLTGGTREAPERQQTLRDTIAWSYDLLSPAEQILFQRLSVFAGGCTLDAAEAVCGAGDGPAILDGITSLNDQSLIYADDRTGAEPRFAMLETIREYALERLDLSGDAPALRAHHAAYYHALALQAESQMFGPERERELARLTAEQDNLRAVLQWGLTSGDVSLALDTAAALQFWFITVSLQEGRRWLESLLVLPAAAPPTASRARALRVRGWLAVVQNDFTTARTNLQESVKLWRTLEDPVEPALALLQLALCSTDSDDPPAISAVEEARALARAAGSAYAAAFSTNVLGVLALRRRDWPAARASFEEAAAIAQNAGAAAPRASFILNAAQADSLAGDLERAAAGYTVTLALFHDLGDQAPAWLIARTLMLRGDIAYRQRDLGEAAASYRESLRRAYQVGSLGAAVRCIGGLGRVAAREQAWWRTAHLLSAAERLESAYQLAADINQAPPEREHALALVAEVRSALGEANFASAWAEGHALSFDDAVALALEQDLQWRTAEPVQP